MSTQALAATLPEAKFVRFSNLLKELSPEAKNDGEELRATMALIYDLASKVFSLPSTKDLPQYYNVVKEWAFLRILLSERPFEKQFPEQQCNTAFLSACILAAREVATADKAAPKIDYDTRVENALKNFVVVKKGTLGKPNLDFTPMIKADPFWGANKELLRTIADLYGHKESSCVLC